MANANKTTASLLQEFMNKTSQPLLCDLKDDMECGICQLPFLSGESPEVPVMLPCRHLYGTSCILKWSSPLSLTGNNSCPQCRRPIFDKWDRDDFQGEPEPVEPFTRNGAARRSARVQAELARLERNAAARGTARLQAELARRLERNAAARRRRTNQYEPSRHDSGPGPEVPVREVERPALRRGRLILSSIFREVEAMGAILTSIAAGNQETPAAINLAPAPVEEDNGIANLFDRAEAEVEEQERVRVDRINAEKKRIMWMQFCEGVVRSVELSTDAAVNAQAPVALDIVQMQGLDDFLQIRENDRERAYLILSTFPRLHTELVLRLSTLQPLPSVNIDARLELERQLGPTIYHTMIHRARWITRISVRMVHAADSQRTLTRLGERLESLTIGAGSGSDDEELTEQEERETREMEDRLLGRVPINVNSAAHVDAALRSGQTDAIVRARLSFL